MNRTFSLEDFDAAIAAKDYIKIKNYIINSIRNNPRFCYNKNEKRSEATEAFTKLVKMKAELPGLFSPYKLQEGETEFDENNKDSWTQEYFIRQTFLLGENFCIERFNNVKKIGQYLAKANFNDPQEVMEGYEKDESRMGDNPVEVSNSANRVSPITIVLIIIAIVSLLVGLFTKIIWLILVGVIILVVTVIYTFFYSGR